jgi:hypothetical protein
MQNWRAITRSGLSAYTEAEQHYRLAVDKDEKAQARKQYQQQDRLHPAFTLERLAECTRIGETGGAPSL